MSILHLASPGPITDKFFPFIDKNLDCSGHKLISFSKKGFGFETKKIKVIAHTNKAKSALHFFIHSNKAEKIIIHGFFGWYLPLLLVLNPWLLKRCYWIIWGGDLYYRNQRNRNIKSNLLEILRKFVIRRFGHFVTHIEGDYELAKEWYGACGEWHECFMYPSNLFNDYQIMAKAGHTINVQVGNSADPSNNHMEILEKLKVFRDLDIKIHVPLSYGSKQHAEAIIKYGIENFGEKFIPLTDLMPLEKYIYFLSKIDIAIFNHRRQQGMGNATTLLGFGKKVYIRSDVTPWVFYKKIGVTLFDVNEIDLKPIEHKIALKNKEVVSYYFSTENLIKNLTEIFKNTQLKRAI